MARWSSLLVVTVLGCEGCPDQSPEVPFSLTDEPPASPSAHPSAPGNAPQIDEPHAAPAFPLPAETQILGQPLASGEWSAAWVIRGTTAHLLMKSAAASTAIPETSLTIDPTCETQTHLHASGAQWAASLEETCASLGRKQTRFVLLNAGSPPKAVFSHDGALPSDWSMQLRASDEDADGRLDVIATLTHPSLERPVTMRWFERGAGYAIEPGEPGKTILALQRATEQALETEPARALQMSRWGAMVETLLCKGGSLVFQSRPIVCNPSHGQKSAAWLSLEDAAATSLSLPLARASVLSRIPDSRGGSTGGNERVRGVNAVPLSTAFDQLLARAPGDLPVAWQGDTLIARTTNGEEAMDVTALDNAPSPSKLPPSPAPLLSLTSIEQHCSPSRLLARLQSGATVILPSPTAVDVHGLPAEACHAGPVAFTLQRSTNLMLSVGADLYEVGAERAVYRPERASPHSAYAERGGAWVLSRGELSRWKLPRGAAICLPDEEGRRLACAHGSTLTVYSSESAESSIP